MSTEELKPCPFCGSDDIDNQVSEFGAEFIQCRACGGDGPLGSSDETAEAAWNRRAAPSPGTGTTASSAEVSMADIGNAAMDWSGKHSSAFRATRENAPAAWDGLMKLIREYGAALAEEARREGYEAGRQLGYKQGITDGHADARKVAAQDAAGEDAVKIDCGSCLGTGNDGRGTGCTDCNGKGYDWETVAEAAAQADDADWMGKIPHAFSNFAAPTAQPTLRPAANAGRNAAQPTPASFDRQLTGAPSAVKQEAAQPTPPDDERAAFEDWLERVHGLDSEWLPERNCFKDYPAHLAFQAFKAGAALRQPGALPDEAEDAARLDWLQEKQATLTRLFDNSAYILSVAGRAVRTGVKVRDVIDAARVAAKQAGKEA